jgi:hypothetical protein
VGMPYGHPEADWLILGPDVEFRRTRYDFNDAIERIRASACPNAEDLFAASILHPPDEALMTATYEKVASGCDLLRYGEVNHQRAPHGHRSPASARTRLVTALSGSRLRSDTLDRQPLRDSPCAGKYHLACDSELLCSLCFSRPAAVRVHPRHP